MRRSALLLVFMLSCFTGLTQPEQTMNPKGFHEIDFQLRHQYRNTRLEPTWPIYTRSFKDTPQGASLPRFEEIPMNKKSPAEFYHSPKGQLFKGQQQTILKVFPRVQAPCVLAKLEISGFSEEHTVKIGFAKDQKNYAMLSSVNKAGNNHFVFEYKSENAKPISQTFPGYKSKGKAYTLYYFLGNDHSRFMILTAEGLKHIGIVENKNTDFTRSDRLQDYSPAFGVELEQEASLSVGEFSAGYFEGIGHADIRSVTYEDGEPIRNKNGNFYISTSARFMGKNGGSGGICVYEMDANGRIVRPVSIIAATKEDKIEAGTAAKLVYDRQNKQWIYVARAFPSPGGKLHIGTCSENILHDGLHLVECNTYDGIVENSLDGDLIKIDGLWYLAYHGGRPRKLHIAGSTDLKNWKEISVTKTGEGIAIAKKEGDHFIIDATSPFKMDVRKMFEPDKIVGSITLSPSPGNHRKHGGFPWGCIIPVNDVNSVKYLMVCFSMDEYMENTSGGIFTYGDIFSYSGAWFDQKQRDK